MSDFVLMHIATQWKSNSGILCGNGINWVGAQDIDLRLNAAHMKGYKYT